MDSPIENDNLNIRMGSCIVFLMVTGSTYIVYSIVYLGMPVLVEI